MAKEGNIAPKKFLKPDGHPRDLVIIHQTAEIPKEGIFLSLNGYPFLAKPGVAIALPRPVRLMIDTLIYTDIIQEKVGNELVETRRDRPRYPYTLVMEDVDKEGKPIDPVKRKAQEEKEKAAAERKQRIEEEEREKD